jgi:hypothetical protein
MARFFPFLPPRSASFRPQRLRSQSLHVPALSACRQGPRLTVADREIDSALLAQEAQHPERPRPILVLTPTNPWLPVKEQTPVRPADVPEEEWAQAYRPIPWHSGAERRDKVFRTTT